MTSSEIFASVLRSETNGETEALLRRLLDTIREGMLIVDGSTRILACNRSAERAFGREGEPLEDRRLTEIIRDAKLHEAFRSVLENEGSVDLKVELIGRDVRSYDVHVSPISLNDSPHAIGVFYDITKIERLERVRQEFLSNISHELRTPLTSIIAYLETLEDGAIDDEENSKKFLGVIRRNAERMHALIADILELSMIESGNVSINKRAVNVAHLVDELMAGLGQKASDRSVSLNNAIHSGSTVSADPTRLEQMLTNLIDNAIKFNRTDGSVTVSLDQKGGRSVITVADTGEGILPEHLHRIFERFYRADRGRTREVGGTGLGLAIVKHLARLHGGEVSVNSALGRGTAFTIEIPL